MFAVLPVRHLKTARNICIAQTKHQNMRLSPLTETMIKTPQNFLYAAICFGSASQLEKSCAQGHEAWVLRVQALQGTALCPKHAE
jgi:hypothetical protein